MMSGKSGDFVKRVALGVVIALAVGTISRGAEALVGDVLDTVTIPPAAQCAGDSGTALAIVPGGKAGFPKIPILLVTSCVATTPSVQAKLFLLDPSTKNPATLVKTIDTTVTPVGGWKALTLRADKGDLLACASPNALYSIDFSPLNTVADGTATFIRNGPTIDTAVSTCAGIAWDSSDKTIYESSTGPSVLHFSETGTATPMSVPVSCPILDSVTGVSVAGTSLFVACAGATIGDEILQRDKVSGVFVRDIPTLSPSEIPFAPGNLAYDLVSFGSQFKDALWTKVAAQLVAVEIPGGTGGQVLGPPELLPAACPATYPTNADGSPKDTDGDGLLDCWEDGTLWSDGLPGISFNATWNRNPTSRDVTLCVETNGTAGFQPDECASLTQKDIFVEIDYMTFHRPDPVAVTNVVNAFANAPGPIRLHVQIDAEIPHNNATALVPCTPPPALLDSNFDTLKTQFFGTAAEHGIANKINAKSFAFHYGLFVHNQSGTGNTSSGCAEIGANDFIVSLGSWGVVNSHNVGTTDQQAGTLMHELGHNLGLRHGGGDNINCKPNYQSVMNYTLQFSNTITGRPLSYSRQLLGVPTTTPSGVVVTGLNEASLGEAAGVGGPTVVGGLVGGKVAFGPQAGIPAKAVVVTVPADGSINWNRDADSIDTVARDLNNLGILGCPALPGTFPTTNAEILEGFDDWAHIQFNFRASVDFAGGANSSVPEQAGDQEITLDQALALSRDVIDIKPNDPSNTLNRGSSQIVNVAIFSRRDDQGVTEFDARDLDRATITLRGTGGATWALPVRKDSFGNFLCKVQDVNGDGLPDIVCQFNFAKNTVSLGETKAVLEATTFDGQYNFHSSDSIKVVR